MLRRNIANHLIFERGYSAKEVTNGLNDLSSRSQRIGIIKTELERPGQDIKSHLYSLVQPTQEELRRVHMLEDLKKQVLDINLLGRVGEKYSRALVKAAGYVCVTQEKMLGKVFDSAGKNSLDLAATNPHTGIRYGVSVKNINRWVFPSDPLINDCISRALAHNLAPWLILPFLSDEARIRCEDRGVKLTELGAQIVPAEDQARRHMRNEITILRDTIGPQPFEYYYAGRFDRTAERSLRTLQLVEQLSRETTRLAA